MYYVRLAVFWKWPHVTKVSHGLPSILSAQVTNAEQCSVFYTRNFTPALPTFL